MGLLYLYLYRKGWRERYRNFLRVRCSRGIIPVEEKFSAPFHTWVGVQPASCKIKNGSFPWGYSGRGVASAAPPYRIEVKERVELYLYPRWTFVA
jgi:hypothetical protein